MCVCVRAWGGCGVNNNCTVNRNLFTPRARARTRTRARAHTRTHARTHAHTHTRTHAHTHTHTHTHTQPNQELYTGHCECWNTGCVIL